VVGDIAARIAAASLLLCFFCVFRFFGSRGWDGLVGGGAGSASVGSHVDGGLFVYDGLRLGLERERVVASAEREGHGESEGIQDTRS
jgi:hypothetical protein